MTNHKPGGEVNIGVGVGWDDRHPVPVGNYILDAVVTELGLLSDYAAYSRESVHPVARFRTPT